MHDLNRQAMLLLLLHMQSTIQAKQHTAAMLFTCTTHHLTHPALLGTPKLLYYCCHNPSTAATTTTTSANGTTSA
jgi:hypothetical protein